MFVAAALGSPREVDPAETSSLVNDSEHNPARADGDDGAFETQSVHEIHDPPNPIRGSGGSGVFSRGREVQEHWNQDEPDYEPVIHWRYYDWWYADWNQDETDC